MIKYKYMKINIKKIILTALSLFIGINFSLAQTQSIINTPATQTFPPYSQPVYTPQTQTSTQNNVYIPNTYVDPTVSVQAFPTFDSDAPCLDAKYDLKIGSRDYSIFGNVAKLQLFLYSNGIMY